MANIAGVSGWITINGNHIPIMRGESARQARQRFLDKVNSTNKQITSTKSKYKKASTTKEVETRMKETLGTNIVKLGRMDVEVANDYNEGIEQFLQDYPEIKGFVSSVDNNAGGKNYGTAELNNINYNAGVEYKGLVTGGTLHLSSKLDNVKYNQSLKEGSDTGYHYKGYSIKSVSYHEMVHLAEFQMFDKENGYLDSNNKPLKMIKQRPKQYSSEHISKDIVNQAKMDVFGKLEGPEVLKGTEFLGKYSYTNSMETVAEAISYERTSGSSNKYSKRIAELFDKKYKEMMGGK